VSGDGTVTVAIAVGVKFPRVPNVVGKLTTFAKSVLKKAGYDMKVIHQETTVPTNRNWEVFDQSPNAGTEALTGKTVTLKAWKNICTPGYSPCLPQASDYDCAGGTGDGPKYTGPVRVYGSDPYGLDDDSDTYGYESS
jgi:hypothetical protein